MTECEQAAETLKQADAVLLGASNGLSIAEGLHLFADNPAFEEVFGDLKRKYGLRCILHGMGVQWPTEEEKWGFWSRLVHRYCSGYSPTPVMRDLKTIVGEKDYFILTSNGECHFEMAGFAPERIYEVEGSWLTMQCACPCHDTVYPSSELLERMAAVEQDGKVPIELVPRCPRCGGAMQVHMDGGSAFIEDTAAQTALQNFLTKYHGKNLVILELGIGPRNRLIKAPLLQLAVQEPYAVYIAINKGEIYIPDQLQKKAFGVDSDLSQALRRIADCI